MSAPLIAAAELLEIGEKLCTQDNRATSHPVYVVEQERRIYGLGDDFTETFEWTDLDGEPIAGDLAEALETAYKHRGGVPSGYRRVGYAVTWEFIAPFFTEEGAETYVQVNRHNLKNPRVFAYSGNRNHEWVALREFLKGLGAEPGGVHPLTAAESLPVLYPLPGKVKS